MPRGSVKQNYGNIMIGLLTGAALHCKTTDSLINDRLCVTRPFIAIHRLEGNKKILIIGGVSVETSAASKARRINPSGVHKVSESCTLIC